MAIHMVDLSSHKIVKDNLYYNERTEQTNSNFSSALNKAEYSLDNKTTNMDMLFKRASQQYGVSLNLLKAVAKAESGFDPNAVSSCGAQGVMQLMPSTATSLGVTNAFNAEQNIMGGAKMLSGLLSQYKGDTQLALAAYNAGSGNVDKYGGIPPFKETQNYVSKVMRYMDQTIDVPQTQVDVTNTSRVIKPGGNIINAKSVAAYSEQIRFLQLFASMMQPSMNSMGSSMLKSTSNNGSLSSILNNSLFANTSSYTYNCLLEAIQKQKMDSKYEQG